MATRRRWAWSWTGSKMSLTSPRTTQFITVKLPDGNATAMGLVVDGVEEVINLAENDIEETPNFGDQICTDYIIGIAKVKGQVKALLDIDGIVGSDTIKSLKTLTAAPLTTAPAM